MAEMCTLLEKHGRVKAAQIAKVRGTSKEWTTICNIKHRGNYKTLILLIQVFFIIFSFQSISDVEL